LVLKATKQTDTNRLTQSVLRFLEHKGHYCSRIQSQGQYNPKLKIWTKSTTKRGIADILAIIHGRAVMIEIKTGKDRQSVWQKHTQQSVEQSGGAYWIVKSLDDLINHYKT
jgi:Holliday junction resolvase